MSKTVKNPQPLKQGLDKKPTPRPCGRGGARAGRGTRNKRLNINHIKALALNSDTLTDAEDQFGIKLAGIFKNRPGLQAAWERGRFLRNLKRLASAAVTVNEAEDALNLERDELKKLLETDREIADIWNQSKLETLIAVKTAIVAAAKEGKHLAAGQVETILRNEFATSTQRDYRRVTINQLAELANRTRRCVYDWVGKHGLPRNSDKTFDLAVFIGWFEQYTIEKLPENVITSVDPMRDEKLKRLRMHIAKESQQLLDRNEVMAGQIARHQNLINSFSHKAEDIALICNGQPQGKIAEILNNFFDEVLHQQCQVPEQLRLTPAIAEKFEEILKNLKPEGEE